MNTDLDIVAAYIAHPLGPMGPDRERNIQNAIDWADWLAANFGISPVMPWVVLAQRWPETEALRAKGLACDKACIRVVELFVMVGGRVSPGMGKEQEWAAEFGKPCLDLTWLGYHLPDLNRVSAESSSALRSRVYQQLCDVMGWEPRIMRGEIGSLSP